MKKILVGAWAFFAALLMADNAKTEKDELEFVDATRNGWWRYAGHFDGARLFKWQKHTLAEYVQKLSKCTDCNRVTTLLVPEFAQAVKGKMTDAEYLQTIEPAIMRLCERHAWGKMVYEAYVANGSLTLTDEQRSQAYAMYKSARKEKV